MKTIDNPFGIHNYSGAEFFCDRVSETNTLIRNITNNSHTAFFALRRMGKTALITHVFHKLSEEYDINCIYIDAYPAQNLSSFTNLLANGIYRLFPEKKGIGKKFWDTIKSLKPVITADPMTGNPELSLDISQPKQLEKTIPQLLQFLDNQQNKTVIAIDEFQQILTFPEKNVEAIIRTSMQTLKNISFIFCGSNQAMMHQIFNNASKPFYASCKSINLQKIDKNEYQTFIQQTFQKFKFTINETEVDEILDYTQLHTYYVQFLCHEIFARNQKIIQPETLQLIKQQILKDREGEFYQYRNLLTPTQWHLLKAFAKESVVFQPYNKLFISKYNLGTPAIVKRTLDALIIKEMVYVNNSIEKPYYSVYDKFLMRWLQNM